MLRDALLRHRPRQRVPRRRVDVQHGRCCPTPAPSSRTPAWPAPLYDLIVPYEGLYAEAPIEGVFGAVDRGLGVLATALGRYDDAERHLEAAIETERRMGARPWHAHAQHDLASMLLARGEPGDRERANVLLAEARSTYGELGMDVWAERASALG